MPRVISIFQVMTPSRDQHLEDELITKHILSEISFYQKIRKYLCSKINLGLIKMTWGRMEIL